ncbi:hypothetical protein Bsp3421_001844 [Burkholderia sp. FERM BP-3421]|jgi:hypothetical protein|uniref:hypothetical protein n=1 Tax=Burkholderia sp. FERM BP-3421 TaxID=1494466 RepID=UPI002362607E|nr:hypothetical protein [Burkholderia sp. FERM BP-3421]WDD91889.1 hypothetical protein Bsp3421_001844 [Burkholderia sp. FERM BP-3421]
MPLNLTPAHLSALAEGEARNFVDGVRRDMIKADPALTQGTDLRNRLWEAYQAAHALGIQDSEHLVQFLKVEAYSPSFYAKPATHAWLTKPGRSADERFHVYVQEVTWRSQHPDSLKGVPHGSTVYPPGDSVSGGGGSGIVSYWKRFIGRGGGSGDR